MNNPMPAGRYYVGDLCYVMSDEQWEEVCELTIDGNNCLEGIFTMKDGTRFAMYSTEYGDGRYPDLEGNQYSVDSGTIGCVLVSSAKKDPDIGLGNVIEFPEEFETRRNRGTIHFGHTRINTRDF